jgi:aryl-alcohol dehydrogenase-like predicted oxidoreductase
MREASPGKEESPMDYRYLGRSALKVSPLCLGAMMFGGETDEGTAARILDRAAERGINFLDTADVYNGGRSEEVTGRTIAAKRDWWVVATKFGYGGGADPNGSGQSRKWIMRDTEASLKRLGTDHIDILYFHRALPGMTLEEGLRAVGDLIRQGKVRYYGVSNFAGWRIAEICRLADQLGMERPVVSQPLYNIVDRKAETEQIPAAAHHGLGIASYSPLARGVLSGKYAPGVAPAADTRAGRGSRPNGAPNRSRSRRRSPRARPSWGRHLWPMRSPGCYGTDWSAPASRAQGPRRSGIPICRRWM